MSNFSLPQAGDKMAATTPAQLTSGISGAKSAYVQLVGSTPFAYQHIKVNISLNAGVAQYLDIAIGASGSEIPIIKDFYLADAPWYPQSIAEIVLSCAIPAGSRISARTAAVGASSASIYSMYVMGYSGGALTSKRAATLERLSTNAISTQLTSTAANVWTDMVASSAFAVDGIVVSTGSSDQYGGQTISIGVGAAGVEATLISGFQPFLHNSGETLSHSASNYFPIRIAAGSRIAIQTTSAGGTLNFSVAGYRY